VHPDLKHFLKKHLLYWKIRSRFAYKETLRQKALAERYRKLALENQLPSFSSTGFKLFSQFEEDGLLLYIFSLLGEKVKKIFVEFGADDGINSNSANLYFHHQWTGLFIDGNKKSLERGKYFYQKRRYLNKQLPTFLHAKITRENINELLLKGGVQGEIGLLSIDIDGNDYWVWEAISVVQAQVVIIETHNEFGLNDIVVPYDAEYFYPGKHPDYHGASPVAMNHLAQSKNYRLIGANALGFNFVFVRNDLLPELPTVEVPSVLQHPSNQDMQARFEAIKTWEYVWNRKFPS
jgi:hypothetical protein